MLKRNNYSVNNCIKVIFIVESKFFIDQDNIAGTDADQIRHDVDCLMKTSEFPKLSMMGSCLSFKGQEAIITSIIHNQYTECLKRVNNSMKVLLWYDFKFYTCPSSLSTRYWNLPQGISINWVLLF